MIKAIRCIMANMWESAESTRFGSEMQYSDRMFSSP